ncbi:MAG: helix-turn-helix domain-containing protein [Planctomycetota bacterium]
MPADEPNLLTTGQAAKLCSVTPDTVLKWIKKGRLDGVRTAGGHYRVERRELEPLLLSQRPARSPSPQLPECYPQGLRCWEYLSDRGEVRDNCQECVVYRVRAARCFLMAGLEPDVGHARQFCQSSCEDCVYYRRVNGLATNVLVITSDDEFIRRLAGEEDASISLRFAANAYEASAIIHDFQPAFAVIDVEHIPAGDEGLLDSLAADARVPGLRVIVVVPAGTAGWKHGWRKHDLVVSVLEKPLGSRPITAVINSLPVDSLVPEDSNS